jgi:L-histidine N-alpha-methyltransferase
MAVTPNHYFERDEHRAAFLASLLDGEVSLKFAYAGSAAQTHDQLARSLGYQSVTLAVELEVTLLIEQFPQRHLTVYDVGSGNGDHSVALVQALLAHDVVVDRLILCDFSSDLMQLSQSSRSPPSDGTSNLPRPRSPSSRHRPPSSF